MRPLSLLLLSAVVEIVASITRQEKEIKRDTNSKERSQFILTDAMIHTEQTQKTYKSA